MNTNKPLPHTYDDALWQLVPREPTPEMVMIGEQAMDAQLVRRLETMAVVPPYPQETEEMVLVSRHQYREMLAAAPSPPAPKSEAMPDDARMRELTLWKHRATYAEKLLEDAKEEIKVLNEGIVQARRTIAALQGQADATDAAPQNWSKAFDELLSDVAQKAMDYSRNTDFGGEDDERLAALRLAKDVALAAYESAARGAK